MKTNGLPPHGQAFEQFNHASRQRHSVFTAALRASGGTVQVRQSRSISSQVAPIDLTGTRGGQHVNSSARAIRRDAGKLGHEGGNFSPRQRWVVALAVLASTGHRLAVAAPTGLSAQHGRAPPRRLRRLGPDRRDGVVDHRGVDAGNGSITQLGKGVTSRVARHCARCLAFRQLSAWSVGTRQRLPEGQALACLFDGERPWLRFWLRWGRRPSASS